MIERDQIYHQVPRALLDMFKWTGRKQIYPDSLFDNYIVIVSH